MKHLMRWKFILFLLIAPLVNASPSIRSGYQFVSGTSNSITLSVPATTQSDDLLIAQIVWRSGTVTVPAGWTLITGTNLTRGNVQQALYSMAATSSSANATYTWTFSGTTSDKIGGSIFALQNAKTVSFVCGYGSNTYSGNTSLIAPFLQPGTYPCESGSLQMGFFAVSNSTNNNNSISISNGTALITSNNGATNGAGNGVAIATSYRNYTQNNDQTALNASIPNTNGSVNGTYAIATTLVFYDKYTPNTCFTDNFNRTSLGADWTVATRNINFTPVINSNRLQLTSNTGSLSAAATLLKLIPASSNKAVITFKYYGYPNYWGGGADGVSVVLSDASITPKPGQTGGSLGYAAGASGSDGFAGGWLAIGLDEYGNFANKNIAGPCVTGVSCATSAVAESVSIRGSAPNYYWFKGTGTLWNVSNNSGHLYRITIDSSTSGKAYLTVERDTSGGGSSYSTLLSAFDVMAYSGQSSLPANFMLSLTGSTGASTNTHEIDDLKVCAATLNNVSAVDHLQLEVTGTPLTCTPSTLTIKACADAACSSLSSAATTVTLGASSGTLGSSSITFTGSTTTTLAKTTTGTTTLSANSSITSGTTTCYKDGTAITGCVYSFADSGFIISVPDHKSCTSQTLTLQAVKKSDSTLKCVPAFDSGISKAIKFRFSYANPSSGTRVPTLNGTNLATASDTSLAMTFTNGSATTTFAYTDAGNLGLTASYTGTTGTETGLSMTGSTAITVAPATFQFSAIPSAPLTAGTPFNATVTAMNGCATPATTPNFGKETTPATVTVTSTNPLPSTGNASAINTTFSDFNNGAASANLTWGEVGTIDLKADVSNYLSASPAIAVTGLRTGVGRFRPAYFTTTVTPACANTFTYSGQPFLVAVTAYNALAAVTANYYGTYAYNTTLSNAGNTANFTNNTLNASTFSAGTASTNTITYTFPSAGNSTLALRATDIDGVSSSGHSEGSALVYSGRVRMLNAYGSELLNLPVSMLAEYWAGTQWKTNTTDNCTTTSLAFAAVGSSDISSKTCVLDTGKPGNSAMGCSNAAASANQFKEAGISGFTGNFNLILKTPGVGNAGSIDITATVPDWLQYPWRSTSKSNPVARATFGKRAANPIIYLREMY